jgi:hypothetical protein
MLRPPLEKDSSDPEASDLTGVRGRRDAEFTGPVGAELGPLALFATVSLCGRICRLPMT